MASMSRSPARTEGRDTESTSVDRSPLGAGYFSGDNDIHHSDESMEAKEQIKDKQITTGKQITTTTRTNKRVNGRTTAFTKTFENDRGKA